MSAGHERATDVARPALPPWLRLLRQHLTEQPGPWWPFSQKTRRRKRNVGGEFGGNDNAVERHAASQAISWRRERSDAYLGAESSCPFPGKSDQLIEFPDPVPY
jgi:hypothetical protein